MHEFIVYLTDDDFFVTCSDFSKALEAASFAISHSKHNNQYVVIRILKNGNYELFCMKYLGDLE